MITQNQLEAARMHPWLRAIYFHDEMVRRSLADPKVDADANIRPASGSLDSPDAVLGSGVPLDIVPDTPVSRQAHAHRLQGEPDQLLSYPPATQEFLDDIFSG